jgi:hypothetical protein
MLAVYFRKFLRFLALGFLIVLGSLSSAQALKPVTTPRLEHVSNQSSGDAKIWEAFTKKRSGITVESSGIVEKILKDDLTGLPHQRFIVRLKNGHSLLIVHNIHLAKRVEHLQKGDEVSFKGEYIYNEKGGLVHWTHHDPRGRHEAGWIEHQGIKYQ